VIPNIAPPLRPEPPPRDDRLIAFVGKLSAGKGLRVFYDALTILGGQGRQVRAVLAGEAGTGYIDPPAAAGVSIELAGRLSSEQVNALVDRAAVFVSPSIWPEPLSRSLLEAMASGAAIVATDVGGTAEAIEHRRSGVLVAPGDPGALAAAIAELLGSPALRAALGAAARQRVVEHFTPEAVVPRLLEVYRAARARR
jgi:2-deoxystreptamine N-acetyl-D-glucosaminyltransferase/2-deoxystreptamine glucosyltransferase